MKHKVLVVEDNELNRAMLCDILSEKYITLEAENGQVALDILRSNKDSISLILLDIMMPVMDGYTFMDILKTEPELNYIPIIVTTQNNNETSEIAALEHGATDFVPKPYSPQIILHQAENLIKLCETAAMFNQFKFDRMTGLYTKEYFYRLAKGILDANADKDYTIVCCNLENFKLYNDAYGRMAGDELLKKFADVLRERVGENAICCRYAADRYLSLIEKGSELISRRKFIDDMQRDRSAVLENVSIKVGVYEIIDRSIPVEIMCDRAIWVVDTIKGMYDQHVAVYDDKLRNMLLREQDITDVMEAALADKQFTVYFQPKYGLADDSMVGTEALVRWIHPDKGFMSPGEFIPLFEKNGFIRRLDEYVWESVCEKLHEWKMKGYNVVPISVNVSRADIYQPDLVKKFCDMVKKYEIDPSMLHLEITESAYTENPEQIISTAEELRENGFVIEMDDFGSGYSSLNMLSQMSLDILKLDMLFIRNELAKPVDRSLLQDIIKMAHRLDLCVVAEGVETSEQKDRLQSMHCDYVQGYYYAKPMPAEEYERRLNA